MYIIYTCITLPKFNSSPSLPTTIFQGHESRSYFDGPTSFPSNLHRLPLIRTHSNPTFVYKVLKKSFGVILNNFKLYTIIYMLYIYRIYPMFLSIQMYIYIYIQPFSSHMLGAHPESSISSNRCWGSQTEVDDLPPVPGLCNLDLLLRCLERSEKKHLPNGGEQWWCSFNGSKLRKKIHQLNKSKDKNAKKKVPLH